MHRLMHSHSILFLCLSTFLPVNVTVLLAEVVVVVAGYESLLLGVGVGVLMAGCVAVLLGVCVAVLLSVGVAVLLGVGVAVLLGVGVAMLLSVVVAVLLGVGVAMLLSVVVAVLLAVGVAVLLGVCVALRTGHCILFVLQPTLFLMCVVSPSQQAMAMYVQYVPTCCDSTAFSCIVEL